MTLVKTDYRNRPHLELLAEPITVLIGVGEVHQAVLEVLNISSVLDLAVSPVFGGAVLLAESGGVAGSLPVGVELAGGLLKDGHSIPDDPEEILLGALAGITDEIAEALDERLGLLSVGDVAGWAPYRAARELAGWSIGALPAPHVPDPEIPEELVPVMNRHATEKSFYSVFVMDPVERPSLKTPGGGGAAAVATPGRPGRPPTAGLPTADGPRGSDTDGRDPGDDDSRAGDRRMGGGINLALSNGVSLDKLISHDIDLYVRTGTVLRFEQAWTPIGLTLGNLLHSLALAPGESTRIAMLDWSRRQGVSTTEDVSQLDALSNSLQQNRSINEITRAIAREAQEGFSETNANSTVSNSAYTTYGLQNGEEALAAAGAGATAGATGGAIAGGAAGVGIGAVGGAIVGGASTSWTGFGIPISAAVGAGLGAFGGGLIGAGSGALVGGAAGGALGFMGAAEFGSALESESNSSLNAITTTGSSGTRDVESEMMQNVASRTQQHASNTRNRRASIVQEVSQNENESVSTRVVTNYNHMHALTVQYFEVVQQYEVRNSIVGRDPVLYVPVRPIQSWTPELIHTFRRIILANALSLDVVYALTTSEGTVGISSPTFSVIEGDWLDRRGDRDALKKAQHTLDAPVSTNLFDGWRLPEDLALSAVYGTLETGGGIFGGESPVADGTLFIIDHGGNRVETGLAQLDDDPIAIKDISALEYDITVPSSSSFDLASALVEPQNDSMRLTFSHEDGRSVEVPVYYQINAEMVSENELRVRIANFSHAIGMAALIEHLNDHSLHYSHAILKSRNNPLLRKMLDSYSFGGDVLADIVDPEPLGVSGNDLVFKMTVRNQREKPREIQHEEVIPVPTGGVFAEAVQGRANSAERLDITRFWDWQDSPIPIVAPEIAPVVMGSRAMAADVRPGSLDPSAIDQMMQAMPDPSGTAAVLATLQSQLFRDMSGIAETAQLATTALQAAAAGASDAGQQVSENLQAGMAHTTEIVGKVTDMVGEYGTMLAEQGFGLLGDVAGAAMGTPSGTSALGGASRGALSAGSAGGASTPRAISAGSGVTRAASVGSGAALGQRNSSIAGALINESRKPSSATTTPGVNPGGGSSGGSGSNGAGSGSGNGTNGHGDVVLMPSLWPLDTELVKEFGGVQDPPYGSTPPPNGVVNAGPPPEVSDIMPALANAAMSDRTFMAAARAALDLIADLEQAGEPTGAAWAVILGELAPAWRVRVDQAVADANDGDLSAITALEPLIAAAYDIPALAGDSDPQSFIDQVSYTVEFNGLQTPTIVEGGEQVAVSGQVVAKLPAGTTVPLPDAPVILRGLPMEPERVEVKTDSDGNFTITATHGVPNPNFNGLHRFEGWYDLDLHLTALSPLSVMYSVDASVLVPGKLEVSFADAIYLDDGSSAKVGAVVMAPVGRIIIVTFAISKGGQPLVGHQLGPGDVTLNGSGQIGSVTDSDDEGLLVVEYIANDADDDVAYLGIVVSHGNVQQAGAAPIDIIDV